MEKKKIMLIVNPCAGRRDGEKLFHQVKQWFREDGTDCSLYLTDKQGDGTDYVLREGKRFDVIACMGGDGTLNEVINGVLQGHLKTPLGYIPAGSTNDFAASMKLSGEPRQAVRDIVTGHTEAIDAGRFDGRYFGYVASFGAFTKTSYATPQSMKNLLGRFSYFLEGVKDLADIHAERKVITADGRRYEGDYVFGAVSNSRTIGGLVKYSEDDVDVSDEKLEMLLIRKPHSLPGLCEILHSLTHQQYENCPYIDFCRSDRFIVESDTPTDWSLDGECTRSRSRSTISCVKHQIRFIRP